MKNAPDHRKAVRGEGCYLFLEDGRAILDMVSSWWVNIHGHGNEQIAEAIYKQALQLEHVIFSEFSHAPAESLAARLLEILPNKIEHLFFSDNGSTAVEVAMKIACQYWWNRGTPKERFIVFEGGYHGDTVGAMSAGSESGFFEPFSKLLFPVDTVPYPAVGESGESLEAKEANTLDKIETLARNKESGYAAILIEPLIQGAGGMRMCRPLFLQKLKSLSESLDILLIFDEVMTGFGRTGSWFASTASNTCPDIICLSKAITGGFMPLAVTGTSAEVFEAFLADDGSRTFYHGHSYTANPLACAAAVASLDILRACPERFENMSALHLKFGDFLKYHHKTRNFRVQGTISAFELNTKKENSYFNPVGRRAKAMLLKRGILMRPLGNTLYLMPPYIITKEELERVYSEIEDMLHGIELD